MSITYTQFSGKLGEVPVSFDKKDSCDDITHAGRRCSGRSSAIDVAGQSLVQNKGGTQIRIF